jgi:hypothetical protein
MKNILFLVILFLIGCASVQSLDGGKKDITPPKVLKVFPDSASTNSTATSIVFTFDEYIKTTKVSDLLLISLSQLTSPTVTVKGKKLIIKLNDTLLNNTTYTVQFNGSVIDNNEGNAILNYNYIFSTGNYIDSLFYTGHIRDILTNKPVENCNVQLYTTFNDSNVLNTKPDYITRTDDQGNYNLTNLPPDSFLAIALLDENKNLLLDEGDYVSINRTVLPTQLTDTLYVFINENSKRHKPKLLKSSPGIYIIKNNRHLANSKIKLSINDTQVDFNLSRSKDSIVAYYTPLSDTSNVQVIIDKDTSLLTKTNNLSELSYTPTVKLSVSQQDLILKLQTPISTLDTSKFILLKDSTTIPFSISNTSPVKLTITASEYPTKLILIKNAITDVLNNTVKGDTFNITAVEALTSNFNLQVNTIDTTSMILELRQGKTLIRQHLFQNNKSFNFTNLPAATYRVIIITDLNNNAIWDTGNTLISKLPEPILISKEFEIRENWDKELIINVK